MRRFEFVEGKSSKFWQIEQHAADLHIQWGRIGTAGQSQVKTFADEGKAQAALTKLIAEKTAKGYLEVGAAPAPAATAQAATPASPPPPAAPQPVQSEPQQLPEPQLATGDETPLPAETVAPWLANGDPVQIPANLMKRVLPSRRFPQPVEHVDAEAVWREVHKPLAALARFDLEQCAPSLRASVECALRRLQQATVQEESPDSDAVLLCLALLVAHFHARSSQEHALGLRFVQYLVARRGLPGAVEILLAVQHWALHGKRDYIKGDCWHLDFKIEGRLIAYEHSVSPVQLMFRRYLAVAPEAQWTDCVRRIGDVLPTLHRQRQIALALLVPDVPELAAAVVERVGDTGLYGQRSNLLLNLRDQTVIAKVIAAHDCRHGDSFWDHEELTLSVLRELGSAAEGVLLHGQWKKATQLALTCIGTPRVVATLALLVERDHWDKSLLVRFLETINRWPLAAIAGLAELLAEQDKDMRHLLPHFTGLLRGHREDLPRLLPWLSPAAAEVLRKEAARLDAPAEIATPDELPPVLVSPPWLQPRAKKAAAPLALEPLALPAEERWPAGEREAILQRAPAPTPGLLDANQLADALEFHASQRGYAAEAIRRGDVPGLLAAWDRTHELKGHSRYIHLYDSDVSRLPDELAVAFWNHALERAGHSQSFYLSGADRVLARYGLRVLPALLTLLQSHPTEAMAHVGHFAAVEIAPLMARAFARLKSQRSSARRWLLNHPEHAACALIAPALGKRGEVRNQAAAALRLLAGQGHEALILDVAARYADPKVVDALRALLVEDPLDLFPAKRSALPQFWQPHCWTRPLLRDSGKALPPAALDALGQMMTFPVVDGLYAGLVQVREACTPQSLAGFAWDCFTAWSNQGAPNKENWAFAMLGHLGNDDTARRLAPLIRNWPSEGGFARSLAGLDVLANIGSDVSLMLLNGIAQKVKSKALQDRAREKIQAIAEARSLSREELEDRLVPTFGLDAQGTLELDFGPRHFTVGFDELLKPYVRDASGARLANLPKPKQSDDAQKSQAASELFKQLKKDVRTIASEQVRRLEAAMCSQRRWLPEAFRQCLVEHPLLRHLVQRLVWGVYAVEDVEDDESGQGGRLLQCFRIAEDGSATSAEDDPLTLPEGDGIRYGLLHALELPAEDAAAFAQLFADYELMQPFAQLGRDTYRLSEAERASGKLLRWDGAVVDTGRLFSLAHRGWQRGTPEDAGYYHDYSKPFDDRRVAMLIFEPGVPVYMPEEEPTQTLRAIYFGQPKGSYYCTVEEEPFATLDAIAASELIRDLENLRA